MADTRFKDRDAYVEAGPYRPMPFRFERLDAERVLMTHSGGEFIIVKRGVFEDFAAGTLAIGSSEYLDLKSRSFLTHGPDAAELRAAASQWRTKKAFLEGGPKLHIFVPTLRCNQSCGYCQVSRADVSAQGVDMTREDASRAIDLMLASPATTLTMEFQGGEPLLAFDTVRWMVETAAERSVQAGKDLRYVICTNLTLLTDEHIAFFRRHDVAISMSLDGPADLHDRNRPMVGSAAHAIVTANIRRCHEELGPGSVSALMTTTKHSLGRAREIIDEYVAFGLHSIFLRELNPYGFATKSAKAVGYDTAEFAAFYREALAHILDLNRRGIPMIEGYASILLRKILTPFGVGFIDLQSPTGEGFGVVLYNHDGGVYASDEARMLAEMGDETFRFGSVSDTYIDLMTGKTMQLLAASGVAECLPGCSDCAFVPYCGADPIRHYRTQGDLVGHRPTSGFCRKQKVVFTTLFDLLDKADKETMNILLEWLNVGNPCLPRPPWLS